MHICRCQTGTENRSILIRKKQNMLPALRLRNPDKLIPPGTVSDETETHFRIGLCGPCQRDKTFKIMNDAMVARIHDEKFPFKRILRQKAMLFAWQWADVMSVSPMWYGDNLVSRDPVTEQVPLHATPDDDNLVHVTH